MNVLLILFAALLAVFAPSCTNLTPDQNDRVIVATIPVVSEIVIRATK